MKDVAKLLNQMASSGVIENYAVFGAVAQMRYTEAVSTFDADILVALPDEAGLDLLSPIYAFCLSKGYKPEGEAILVGDWPVQFIPAFDDLTREALRHAEQADMEGEVLNVVNADYLAVIALRTGRTKDRMRVASLLESGAVSEDSISTLAAAHRADGEWEAFKERYL